MRTLQGIHTALITPFTDDDAVDLPAFERLVARQVDAGIHGLVPCGTTGETPTLTQDEQDAVIASTVRVAAGRVPVIAGIGANSTKIAVQNAARVAKLGVDAGLLVFPWYNKPNPDGLRAHVRAVAAVGLPIVLYHVPGRTAHHLPAPLLAELCSLEGVIGVKEALIKSAEKGMQSYDVALYQLYLDGKITLEEAVSNADSRTNLEAKINFG